MSVPDPRPRRGIALLLTTGLALLLASRAAWGQETACPVPEGYVTSEATVPRTAQALRGGARVSIVTLGGSSTLGVAAGGADLAWPSRLNQALAARFAAARVDVVNLAKPRQTAQEAAGRLARDVVPRRPMLVVWETGTVEAVQGTPVDEFRETVQTGINELRTAGIEVILMNAQFSRDTDAMIHFNPYLAALRDVANANTVPVFRRYGLMRHWAETGVLDLRTKDGESRRRLAARLYECIARALADLVTRP